MNNFPAALAFAWLPANDGQPYHVTLGDRGGATAWGVTLATWSAWEYQHGKRVTTAADLKAASKAQLEAPIRAWYWDEINADELPTGVDLLAFDFGFTSGASTSAKLMQKLAGVVADGQVGIKTITAVAAQGTGFIDRLWVAQTAFYRALGQPQFLNGWLRRCNDRHTLALTWLGAQHTGKAAALAPTYTPPPRAVVDQSTIDAALDIATGDTP